MIQKLVLKVVENFSNVGIGLYGVLHKKFHILLLQDHLGRMVINGQFQRQFRNNYFIFKSNYFIIISFSINFHNNYFSPFLIIKFIL
jgi:hypothetical protein